jgi:hypothetical protein
MARQSARLKTGAAPTGPGNPSPAAVPKRAKKSRMEKNRGFFRILPFDAMTIAPFTLMLIFTSLC